MKPEDLLSFPLLTVSFIVHEDFSYIENAINSLFASSTTSFDVYLTINKGHQLQVDQICEKFPELHLKVNTYPQGFAANHNAVMRMATTPFVALVNDDVEFHPGAIDTLVEYLQTHSDAGIVGPLVENPDGTAQLSTFNDPTLLRMLYQISGLNHFTGHGGRIRRLANRLHVNRYLKIESLNPNLTVRDVPVVVGVAMVARRDAYLKAGLMDENTLVYGEEVGWHWRMRQKGFRVVFVPAARVTHFNQQQDLSGWKLAEHRKGILAYFLLYRPHWQAVIIRLGIAFFHALATFSLFFFNRQGASSHWQTTQMALKWKLQD